MAHKRIEFTENKKAEIYVRDRATCAFSGLSLWLLDLGISPNWQMDWVDHIKPSASGGGANLENGICASHTFNAKKRNNASDNIFFVQFGNITENYIQVFGTPPKSLIEQLSRLKNLEVSDWFLNRCIANTFIAFNWRCNLEFNAINHKRDDIYWFSAAWKRFEIYYKKRGIQSCKERDLINEFPQFGVHELLEIENINTKDEYLKWAENIYPKYKANYQLLNLYLKNKEYEKRNSIINNAQNTNDINPELLKTLSVHLEMEPQT